MSDRPPGDLRVGPVPILGSRKCPCLRGPGSPSLMASMLLIVLLLLRSNLLTATTPKYEISRLLTISPRASHVVRLFGGEDKDLLGSMAGAAVLMHQELDIYFIFIE